MATEAKPTLAASKRENSGKGVARKLRAEGLVPGTCYGNGMDEAVSVTLNPDDVIELFTHAKGRNVVFDLKLSDDSVIQNVMVKDYQVSPVRRELLHVDFFVVDLDREVRAKVPLKSVGRSAGVKQGGILNIIRPDIDIKARPMDIPDAIEVDVTELLPGQTILAADVDLPEGVSAGFRANYGLFRIVMPRKKAALLAGEEQATA